MESTRGRLSLQGVKFFKPVRALLSRLSNERSHPNRKLHYDEYISLLLLAFYQPTSQTLRWVQQASALKTVQKKLGVSRASLGSLSEASQVFDPEPLRQIFLELAGEAAATDALPRPRGVPDDLQVLAADGTLWETLPRMARELWLKPLDRSKKGGFKGHLQFDVFRHVPCSAQFSMGEGGEAAELKKHLRGGALYLLDRGFVNYDLYTAIIGAGSSFLARLKDNCALEITAEQPVGASAAQTGVQLDATVMLGKKDSKMKQPLRLIRARVLLPPPHNLHPQRNHGKHKAYAPGESREQELVLITDRFDLDADVLVLLYRYRWQVEIFFRWFKCVLGSKHLMANSENGLNLQMYAALIASLLVVIWTGRRPTQRLLNAINFYLIGWSSWAEFKAELDRAAVAKP
jgi:hypothetical protein